MQNFELFKAALSRMGLSCAPPPSKRGADLKDVLPCLIELAALATKHGIAMGQSSSAPVATTTTTEPSSPVTLPAAAATTTTTASSSSPPSPRSKSPHPPLTSKQSSETGFLADDEADATGGGTTTGGDDDDDVADEENMNSLLGSLHQLRMERQKAKPPKLKFMKIGGKELMIVERPGEAVGSIVWDGAAILVRYLHDKESVRFTDPQSRVLELGSGVGVCGIWAACQGSDVVVTDIPGSVDLLWANVAANAQTIVNSGGSCSARALDFHDVPAAEKLVAQMGSEGPLTVLASDVVYNDTIDPLRATVAAIFKVRPDATMYLSYRPRDSATESVFFDKLASEHGMELTKVGGEDKTMIFRCRIKAENLAV
jgi:predicted nicotinamide N-methyase